MASLLALSPPIIFLFIFVFSFTSCLKAAPTENRPEIIRARHAVVATDDRRCSRIGRNVLQEGGHAVDAAVAATLCLGVVSPASSGLGGGAFMLIRSSDGKAQAYDMRETAPILASQNMYAGKAANKVRGALSAAVPGELAGLYKAWEQYGKLPWKRLVRSARYLAQRGFKISRYLHFQMDKTRPGIMADKGLFDMFTANGSLLQPGDICYNKKLAKTLEAISEYGAEALYNGSVGYELVRDIRNAGGILTIKDLKNYQVKLREPISAEILGLKIIGMPPPSSGGAAMVLMLNILAQYGIPVDVSGQLVIHRQIESLKHAFAVKANLGDPDHVNVTKVLADMLSPKFATKLKKAIYDNMTFSPRYYGSRWNQIPDHGTSHMSIVDGERNAVSITSTINYYFGSTFMSQSTGIILNNEMDDFSIPANVSANIPPPAPANFINPGKRPLSSMAPTIVLKGEHLKGVLGASGGSMIIAGTTEVFVNYFFKGMDPLASVRSPRFYHQLIPNVVQYENWTSVIGDHYEVPEKTREVLKKKGHVLEGHYGGTMCQFIVQELKGSRFGQLLGVSDPRKNGVPAGF